MMLGGCIHGWPAAYDARGVADRSHLDAQQDMDDEENRELYQGAMGRGDRGWRPEGRMTTYAGSGVGLVREAMSAARIVNEVQEDAVRVIEEMALWFRE